MGICRWFGSLSQPLAPRNTYTTKQLVRDFQTRIQLKKITILLLMLMVFRGLTKMSQLYSNSQWKKSISFVLCYGHYTIIDTNPFCKPPWLDFYSCSYAQVSCGYDPHSIYTSPSFPCKHYRLEKAKHNIVLIKCPFYLCLYIVTWKYLISLILKISYVKKMIQKDWTWLRG